ncbi:AraC-like DNA-binding protein [Pararhizobium capsulatum DSM 1112]|uniref:AraC-like DNA-binding protein n=1 Tax=Pararhizobium capsulatum DSM 1112 TaxID=1121113 RepID=A0ABU0BY72_9HYPH|nr:AraC family transcriptional regulator [Pararhizobium capsulatum]MDQ0322596.1 AraC-like DNA-binding protein [Pararhizobium capsulatum DSM 1112]
MQMNEMSGPGDRIAACFGVKQARTLTTTPLHTAKLSITHLAGKVQEGGRSVTLPADDAFLVMLYLVDVRHCDILPDASTTLIKTYPKGSICLISLKHGAAICIRSDFDALAFHIPSSLLDEVTDEAGEPLLEGLLTCRGVDDPVISNLGAALLPMFDAADAFATPLVAQVSLAFNAHIAHRYGCLPGRNRINGKTLSFVQEKRAKDFMIANFQRDLSLAEVALASGLAEEDFVDGFEASTGHDPMSWLLAYRIDRAKDLLSGTGLHPDYIARKCGFIDEHHMSEIFSREINITASAWRLRDRH